jgi:ribosomal-protein-alanine N-acetyltransferase
MSHRMNRTAGVTIAVAGPSSAAVLASLHAACFTEAWDEAAMAGLLEAPSTAAALAGCGDTKVGVILWRIAADEAEVLTIGVVADARRRGVGLQLMAAAMAHATARGARRFLLEVAEDNVAALALYRRLGFAVVGCRPKYYQTAGVDALILARDLARDLGRDLAQDRDRGCDP